MSKLEELRKEYNIKLEELDRYVSNLDNDIFSDEAERIRHDIFDLQDKINLFERVEEIRRKLKDNNCKWSYRCNKKD